VLTLDARPLSVAVSDKKADVFGYSMGAIVHGLENAPAAFIGLLEGRNFGKLVSPTLEAPPPSSGFGQFYLALQGLFGVRRLVCVESNRMASR
jgi:hypothetical protein